jgi:hypothetical protein
MKKIDYAKILTSSPAWDGIKDPYKLVKLYSKAELKDAYDMLADAEAAYYDMRYGY